MFCSLLLNKHHYMYFHMLKFFTPCTQILQKMAHFKYNWRIFQNTLLQILPSASASHAFHSFTSVPFAQNCEANIRSLNRVVNYYSLLFSLLPTRDVFHSTEQKSGGTVPRRHCVDTPKTLRRRNSSADRDRNHFRILQYQ